MSVVREPSADAADPFGDYTALAPTPSSAPPTSDTFRAPYSQPDIVEPPPPESGGLMGGILHAGVARMIGIGVVIAVMTGGFGMLRGSVANDGPPNVPLHVIDACNVAKVAVDPSGLVTGTHTAYQQSGADVRVTFEASSGSTWTCLYHPATGSAAISGFEAFE